MRYQRFSPIPALVPYIECFWIIESSGQPGVTPRSRMPADSRATLLLNFVGESRMIADDGSSRFVGVGANLLGVHSQSYTLEHDGDTHLIAAQFRPGGLAPFMRYGVSELAEQAMPLEALWGSDGHWLCEQIEAAATLDDKMALHQTALLRRFAEVPHQTRILHALGLIEAWQGRVSVDWLAEQTNLSQKQFERLFARVVGMMPKRYLRLARFQKLVGWLRHSTSGVNWAALAAEFGYYDHSHLVKDFQAFAGTTPTDFAAATAGVVEVAYGS